MKQLLLFIFLLLPGIAESQITITESDMPNTGDTYILSHPFLDLLMDVNATGDNYSWDYSDLVPISSSTDTFSGISALPLLEQIFFLFSNLADRGGVNLNFGGLTVQDVFTVYKKSSSKLQVDGYAGTLNGLPVVIIYNPADVLYHFPIDFGNIDSSDATYSFNLPGLIYIAQQRHRVNSVDGWGSIITPVGTYSAVRIKSVITDVDSIYLDTLGFGSNIPLKSYEYKWLAQGSGLPVFQVNATDVLGIPVITDIMYQDTAIFNDIADIHKDHSLKVFPNPADNIVHFSLPGTKPASILIYDALGRKVMDEKNLRSPVNIAVSTWRSGIYFVHAVQDGKSFTSSFFVNP